MSASPSALNPAIAPNLQSNAPPASNTPTPEAPHLLALKVLRLSKPSVVTNIPVFYEGLDKAPTRKGLDSLTKSDPTSLRPLYSHVGSMEGFKDVGNDTFVDNVGISPLLSLPKSFGNIYLGETFSSYISLHNDTLDSTTQESAIKVELQTATQRFTLADTSDESLIPQLKSGQSRLRVTSKGTSTKSESAGFLNLDPKDAIELVVQHDIKELGVHILVCTIQYVTPQGERRFFRKFYKFQVLNPLAVRTKVSNASSNQVLLEVQVQNMTTSPMFFELLKFEPNDSFTASDLNYVNLATDKPYTPITSSEPSLETLSLNESAGKHPLEVGGYTDRNKNVITVFGQDNLLQPQDIRQYLYLLKPKTEVNNPQLGKLDIAWTTTFGETGRLQTSQLVRKVPPTEPLETSILSVPSQVSIEKPFGCKVRLRNNTTAENMKVSVTGIANKAGGVLWSGPTVREVELGPGESHDLDLNYLPVLPGLQKVGALKLVDLNSGFVKDIESLAEVNVQQ